MGFLEALFGGDSGYLKQLSSIQEEEQKLLREQIEKSKERQIKELEDKLSNLGLLRSGIAQRQLADIIAQAELPLRQLAIEQSAERARLKEQIKRLQAQKGGTILSGLASLAGLGLGSAFGAPEFGMTIGSLLGQLGSSALFGTIPDIKSDVGSLAYILALNKIIKDWKKALEPPDKKDTILESLELKMPSVEKIIGQTLKTQEPISTKNTWKWFMEILNPSEIYLSYFSPKDYLKAQQPVLTEDTWKWFMEILKTGR
jgi:hypothetical protein